MRQKLFSTGSILGSSRIKLFSGDAPRPETGTLRELICGDCGEVVVTAEHPSHAVCPNCGGSRLNIKLFPTLHSEPKYDTTQYRLPLFPETPFETNLRDLSGKSISRVDFEKTFSDRSQDLIEKGFANVVGDQVEISPYAYEAERVFSKMIISVTKTLELDPEITCHPEVRKEDIIDQLEGSGRLPERNIVILRKAHGLYPREASFSAENEGQITDWLNDSSIIPDLELEYNNQSFGVEQFLKIIRERYPDAPENILDILVENGTARLDGTQVTIQSNSNK